MNRGFYLSLMMGPVVPVPVPLPVIESLLSVQVTQGTGTRGGFQIQLGLGKLGVVQGLLVAGAFDPLIRVVVTVVVNGLPEVLIDGLITRHDVAPSNDPGKSTLTLTGEDVSVAMSLQDLSQLIPYPGMPPEVRVLTIIGRYAMFGMIPTIIPSIAPVISNPLEEWPWHQGTDYDYVTSLASETGYVFQVIPGPAPGTNVAYWGPPIRLGPPQRALSVNMDAHTNVETLSFGFEGTTARMPVMVFYEPRTHAPIPVPIPAVGVLRPPMALKPAIPFPVFQRQEAGTNIGRAVGVGLARAASTSDNATGNGTLDVLRYGQTLKPRLPVGVRGAGLAYDGLWYVKSVTHNIKRGEYKQSFNLVREGLLPTTPLVIP
jgi:hypothetical protein